MIAYNDTSKLLFAQNTKNDVINMKSKTAQISAPSDFKSVFDATLGSPTAQRQNLNSKADSQLVKYKAFRELNQTRTAAADNTQTVSADKVVAGTDVKPTDSVLENSELTTYDESIYALAQLLGIQPGDLIKLAEMLGFSREDLCDPAKVNLLADKLSNLVGLDAAQLQILKSAISEISSQMGKESDTQTEANKGIESSAENKAAVETPKAVEVTKLAEIIKTKLNELIENSKTNPETVATEVSKVIAVMKSQAKANITSAQSGTETVKVAEASSASIPTATEDTAGQEGIVKSEEPSGVQKANAADSSGSASKEESEKQMNEKAAAPMQSVEAKDQISEQEQPDINIIGDIKANLAANQAINEKAAKIQIPVKASEVINQVVENAKVIVGQDKSEMVIHLKPDHLGKLELKVVTEQGIVAAKFIAESQQVKEVIETNMQLLKDSLQKQGISIDGVSVQVGQENTNQYRQPETNAGNKYSINQTDMAKTGISLLGTLPDRLAQYTYDANTINLTA